MTQQPSESQGVEIGKLLKEIQLGLAKAQEGLVSAHVPLFLKSATLNLVAEAKQGIDGTINLFIVTFGKKWEKALTQEIEITLTPPKKLPQSLRGQTLIGDELAKAVVSAGLGIHESQLDPSVPLVASCLRVVISCVVAGTDHGGLSFKILPVKADLGGELANAATQKVAVVFESHS